MRMQPNIVVSALSLCSLFLQTGCGTLYPSQFSAGSETHMAAPVEPVSPIQTVSQDICPIVVSKSLEPAAPAGGSVFTVTYMANYDKGTQWRLIPVPGLDLYAKNSIADGSFIGFQRLGGDAIPARDLPHFRFGEFSVDSGQAYVFRTDSNVVQSVVVDEYRKRIVFIGVGDVVNGQYLGGATPEISSLMPERAIGCFTPLSFTMNNQVYINTIRMGIGSHLFVVVDQGQRALLGFRNLRGDWFYPKLKAEVVEKLGNRADQLQFDAATEVTDHLGKPFIILTSGLNLAGVLTGKKGDHLDLRHFGPPRESAGVAAERDIFTLFVTMGGGLVVPYGAGLPLLDRAPMLQLFPRSMTPALGRNQLLLRNHNDTPVLVGLRGVDGSVDGQDFEVAAQDWAVIHVPNGSYRPYFVYVDEPETLYQGSDLVFSNGGIELSLKKDAPGNFQMSKVAK